MSNSAKASLTRIVMMEASPPPKRSREETRAIARKYLENLTDEEDAAITAAALSDPDNPPLDLSRARRLGRPPLPRTKRSVHLRLDQEIVDFFVEGGPGWQTRINAALRKVAGLK